ncbi:hypothetical protein ACTFIT_002822 [Dictyostelium discoideum]
MVIHEIDYCEPDDSFSRYSYKESFCVANVNCNPMVGLAFKTYTNSYPRFDIITAPYIKIVNKTFEISCTNINSHYGIPNTMKIYQIDYCEPDDTSQDTHIKNHFV